MKALLTIGTLVALSTGCARFSTTQTDIRYDDQGKPATAITTKATASTFFAGKSTLANWKAAQASESQTAEVGQLDSEVAGVGDQLSVIVQAVAEGVSKGLKP